MKYIEHQKRLIEYGLLSLIIIGVMFPVGLAVFALNNLSNYLEKEWKCEDIEKDVSEIPNQPLIYQEDNPNNPPIVKEMFKECT